MIKRVGFLKRQPTLSPKEFHNHWVKRHATMARHMPGLRGYRINLVQEWDSTPEWWDGYGELWFDDVESMRSGFADLGPELIADRDLFASRVVAAVVSEHVIAVSGEV